MNKVIYGLKQAPIAWYLAFKEAILANGFKNSSAHSSLFIYNVDFVLCYLLVYVDDLVITRNDIKFMSHMFGQLDTFFFIKGYGKSLFLFGNGSNPYTRRIISFPTSIYKGPSLSDKHGRCKASIHSAIHKYQFKTF